MRRRAGIIGLLVASCVSGSQAVLADHVDDIIAAQMKERGIPGAALAVVESSTIVGEQAYGWSDKDW